MKTVKKYDSLSLLLIGIKNATKKSIKYNKLKQQ